MTLHWPQIVWLILTLTSLGVGLEQHGKPKKPGTNSGWISLFAWLIHAGLLYAGGFFG